MITVFKIIYLTFEASSTRAIFNQVNVNGSLDLNIFLRGPKNYKIIEIDSSWVIKTIIWLVVTAFFPK